MAEKIDINYLVTEIEAILKPISKNDLAEFIGVKANVLSNWCGRGVATVEIVNKLTRARDKAIELHPKAENAQPTSDRPHGRDNVASAGNGALSATVEAPDASDDPELAAVMLKVKHLDKLGSWFRSRAEAIERDYDQLTKTIAYQLGRCMQLHFPGIPPEEGMGTIEERVKKERESKPAAKDQLGGTKP